MKTASTIKLHSRLAAKMERPAEAELTDMPASWIARYGKGPLLIPTPRLIESLVRKVRKGRVTTIPALRAKLARDHDAAATCPLTTGIFLRIVAEYAEEQRAAGVTRITPYWRVVKEDGSLNEKFPGGSKAQADKLREEGIALKIVRGKPRVEEVERQLQAIP